MMKGMFLFPVISFLLIIWGNSDYSPSGTKAGFYCNDTTIKKPYHGDSINVGILFLSLLVGAAIILYISEKLSQEDESSTFEFKHYLKYFYSGFLYVLAFTEILKLSSQELRPHFYYTCQPDVDQEKCSNGLVTEFNCTGVGPKWLVNRDIYKSFPSGHASLSFYAFVFVSMHIYKKLLRSSSSSFCTAWRHIIPTISLMWTIICCISRLLDHRHFWWDVLVGVVIGLMGGVIMISLASRHITTKQQKVS